MKLLIKPLLSHLKKSLPAFVLAGLVIIPIAFHEASAFAEDAPAVVFSQAELDQMLAPIALYPDALLSQVLIASTYPLEIVQADRWVRSNKDLKTEDALKFAENKDWDPSVKSLVAFPDILKRMSTDIDWSQRLGDAFLSDEESVMDAVQRLRKRAYATGNLDSSNHIRVENDDNNIIIEPAEERVVYVPVYDPRVVYGNWWWSDYPPVYWNYPSSYVYTSGFYWGTSIYLGSNFFYSSPQWRNRRVVVIDRHNYGSNTHFYTGRSIVNAKGAYAWHHDPVHRHGVAYFNNNLRTAYGSRHESYQNERAYRDNHDNNRNSNHVIPNGNHGINTSPQTSHVNHNINDDHRNNTQSHEDKAEHVRERLGYDKNAQPKTSINNGLNPPLHQSPNMNATRTEADQRNRAVMVQHRQEANTNANNNQERRLTPERSAPDNTNHQPNFERRIESQRQVEAPQPRNDAGRAQQRSERANVPEVFRHPKKDKDDDKK